jgi:hypothetical protein
VLGSDSDAKTEETTVRMSDTKLGN